MKIFTILTLLFGVFLRGNVSAQSFKELDSTIVKSLKIKSIQAKCYWTDSLVQEGIYFWTYDEFGNRQSETYRLNDSTFYYKSTCTYDSLLRLSEVHTFEFDKNFVDTIIEFMHYDNKNKLIRKTFDLKYNLQKRTDYFYENDLCISELDILNDGINITRSIFNKYNSKKQLISQLQVLTSFVGGTTTKEVADVHLFYKEFSRDKKNVLIENQYAALDVSKENAQSNIRFEYYYSKDNKLEKVVERNGDTLMQTIIYNYTFY